MYSRHQARTHARLTQACRHATGLESLLLLIAHSIRQSLANLLEKVSTGAGTFTAAGSAAAAIGLLGLPEDVSFEGVGVTAISFSSYISAGSELGSCLLNRQQPSCTGTNVGLDLATLFSPPILILRENWLVLTRFSTGVTGSPTAAAHLL